MNQGLIGAGTSISAATIASAGTNAIALTKLAGDTGSGSAFTGNITVPAGSFLQVTVAGNTTNAGGNGTKIAVTGNVTQLARLQKVTPPKQTVAKVDVSGFDAQTTPNGNPIEDQIPGWITPGEYEFTLYYQKGGSTLAMLNAMLGGTNFWIVNKPDSTGYAFQAYLAEIGDEIPLKEGMTVTVKLQISGGSCQQIIGA